jgi:hypothetical protein
MRWYGDGCRRAAGRVLGLAGAYFLVGIITQLGAEKQPIVCRYDSLNELILFCLKLKWLMPTNCGNGRLHPKRKSS